MADQTFLGNGWSFPPTFRREFYGVEMVDEAENVRKSIEIILSTRSTGQVTVPAKDGVPQVRTISGERVMQPSYGCNLLPYVFEPMNAPNRAMIEKVVHDALVLNEPRIIVEQLSSSPNPDEGVLYINIEYTIIRTNTRYNYVFPFYMQEATNLVK